MSRIVNISDAPRLLQPGVGLGSPGGLRNPSAGASQLGNTFFVQIYSCSRGMLINELRCYCANRILLQPSVL